jgi:thymidine kinase
MVLNKHIRQQVEAMGIKTHRPVVQDFHDERISTCHIDEADKLVEAKVRAMDRLNDELNPEIKFSGTPEVGDSIWSFKA